jgi:hypothetical protein
MGTEDWSCTNVPGDIPKPSTDINITATIIAEIQMIKNDNFILLRINNNNFIHIMQFVLFEKHI